MKVLLIVDIQNNFCSGGALPVTEGHAMGYMHSFEGPIHHDPETGRPLNPLGRIGISGRGALGKWGPNHAADALLTRCSTTTGLLEVLLIQRQSGEWAIPGGMVDAGEDAYTAACSELTEGLTPPVAQMIRKYQLYK